MIGIFFLFLTTLLELDFIFYIEFSVEKSHRVLGPFELRSTFCIEIRNISSSKGYRVKKPYD